MPTVRLIKHEAVPQCGSYEVRYTDGRPSRYFYWLDVPGRRMRLWGRQAALEAAQELARAEQDRLEGR